MQLVQQLEDRKLMSAFWISLPVNASDPSVTTSNESLHQGKANSSNYGQLQLLSSVAEGNTWQEAVTKATSGYATTATYESYFFGNGSVGTRFKVGYAGSIGLNGTEGTLANYNPAFPSFAPLKPDQRVIGFEDGGDGDGNDAYWAVNVGPMSKVSLTKVQDGSEEPAVPYNAANTPKPVKFKVSRAGTDISQSLVVTLNAPTGTATEGVDYQYIPRNVTIPAGKYETVFSVKPIWDAKKEPKETIRLSLNVQAKTPGGVAYKAVAGAAYEIATAAPVEGGINDEFVSKITARALSEEGKRYVAYKDTKGFVTIGIGHNLGAPGDSTRKAEFENVTGVNFDKAKAGQLVMTEAQVQLLFDHDLNKAILAARSRISNFKDQPLKIKEVLVDLCFNQGSLTKWPDFCASIIGRNYKQAVWDLGHKSRDPASVQSDYSKQLPNRYARNVALINEVATEYKP